MRVAFLDSGLGSLSASSVLRTRWPTVDLTLSIDPDFMPWGSLSPDRVTARVLALAEAAVDSGGALGGPPDALVIACNTGSVLALEHLRSSLEPGLPVIGTVPAIKPAAAACSRVTVWSTPATASSDYHRALVAAHRGSATVETLACDGLAAAIESGSVPEVQAAVAHWASLTPPGTEGLVLGSTHYRLAEDLIGAALPGVTLFDSAEAVVAQVGRRLALPSDLPGPPGAVTVLESGRPSSLPDRALAYRQGRILAGA